MTLPLTNQVTWDGEKGDWIDGCTFVACPSNMFAERQGDACVCQTGYEGQVVWVNGAWVASCTQQACPAPETQRDPQTGYCMPGIGYDGLVKWDSTQQIWDIKALERMSGVRRIRMQTLAPGRWCRNLRMLLLALRYFNRESCDVPTCCIA
jgi:hypothetical protein